MKKYKSTLKEKFQCAVLDKIDKDVILTYVYEVYYDEIKEITRPD